MIRLSTKTMLWVAPWILPAYLLRFSIYGLPSTVLELYVFVVIAFYAYEYRDKKWIDRWNRLGRWKWPVVAWLLIGLASACVAPNRFQGLGLWRAYILEPLVLFFIAMDVLRDETDIKQLQRNFFLVTIGLSLWAAFQYATGFGIPHPWNVGITEGRRATGPYPYPNALALFVAPIGVMAFAKAKRIMFENGWSRSHVKHALLPLSAAFASLVAILLAKSDGALISIVVVAWGILFLERRTRKWVVVATMIGLIVAATFPGVRTPLYKELTFQGWSGIVRRYIWRESWQMLKAHPITGAGLGGYPTVFAPFHKATAIEIFQYPHTIVFNFWSETGILGLATFFWIVWTWARYARRAPRGERFSMLAPLFAILIHGLVDVPYFKNDLAIQFWLIAWLSTLTHSSAKG